MESYRSPGSFAIEFFCCKKFCFWLRNLIFKKFWAVFKLMVKLSPHLKETSWWTARPAVIPNVSYFLPIAGLNIKPVVTLLTCFHPLEVFSSQNSWSEYQTCWHPPVMLPPQDLLSSPRPAVTPRLWRHPLDLFSTPHRHAVISPQKSSPKYKTSYNPKTCCHPHKPAFISQTCCHPQNLLPYQQKIVTLNIRPVVDPQTRRQPPNLLKPQHTCCHFYSDKWPLIPDLLFPQDLLSHLQKQRPSILDL